MKLYRLLFSVAITSSLFASCKDIERDYGPGRSGDAGEPPVAEGGAGGDTGSGGRAPTSSGGAGGSTSMAGAGGDGNSGECAPDARRCAGDVPELCGIEGSWEATQSGCAFGCLDGACRDCEEGTQACEGGQAKLCVDAEWQFTSCDSQCEEGECVDTCTEGTRQCDGQTTVQICNAGVFVEETQCDGLCVKGECVGECLPDATRCATGSTGTVERCSAVGQWESSTCPSSTSVCLGGACVACSPEAARCSLDGGPQQCTEFGAWADQAPCSGETPACVDGACQPCTPSTRRCNVGRPQQCNATGTAWVDGAACTGSTPACVAATGQCGTCQDGDVQCGDATTPQTCDASGKWVAQTACRGSTPACVHGACTECAPNATRCVGNTPQVCSGEGKWVSQAGCTGSTPQCLPASGQCGCTAGAVDCADSNTPIACSAGTWVPQADCRGDTPVCDGGACVCSEGSQECTSATTPRKCTGGAWKSSTCPVATPVCIAGNCGECSPNTTRCATDGSPLLETCSADGVWKRSETCSGLCYKNACVNVPCTEQPLLTGAYNFRCRLNAAVTTPGGELSVPRDYLLGSWSGTSCFGYGIGSASVFTYAGNQFMRFQTVTRTLTTDPGVKTTGTLWLQSDGRGNISATELCDPAQKGKVTAITYQQTATQLFFNLPDRQYVWDAL